MTLILETERLILRQFDLNDTDFILKLLNSPGWLRFIGDRNIRTTEDAKDYLINGPIKSYQTIGFGLSLVALKDNELPIGMCGIIKRDNLENVDIGFAFLDEYTGKGYAFEIASATIKYAKEVLKLETILAITDPKNVNSIKLLNKIGLSFDKIIKFPEKNEELMLFKN